MILISSKVTILREDNKIKVIIFLKEVISDRISLYTLFLSPKGKLISDAFIYKPKVFLNGKKQFR
jgi:hypothetical protein